jgi:hypothetical protein
VFLLLGHFYGFDPGKFVISCYEIASIKVPPNVKCASEKEDGHLHDHGVFCLWLLILSRRYKIK